MARLLLLVLAAYALPGGLAGDQETVLPIEKSAAATIHLNGYPDWLEIGFGSLWVSNAGIGAVQRLDLETNKVVAEVAVNRPCAAMAAGYDSVWVASRADKSIFRIDAKTNKVAAAIPVTIADSEASIAADVARANDGWVFERGSERGAREEGGRARGAGTGDGVEREAPGRRALIADEGAELGAGDLQAGVGGALHDGLEVDVAGEQKARLGDELQLLIECARGVQGDSHATPPSVPCAG